jgi:glycine/D-amino acid oxidase-like deaminating enzyme/nitrite reductase/ring-hydroxylating ferredoxin subunit
MNQVRIWPTGPTYATPAPAESENGPTLAICPAGGAAPHVMAEIDTTPYWQASAAMPRFAALDRDLAVDVVVVGAGITGITAAYLLKQAGRTVALLERDRCVGVDTGHTTAHLTCLTDTRLTALIRDFGADHARAVWDAGLAAINRIDDLVRQEQIDCDFAWVPGYLHAPLDAASDEEADSLRQEAAAAADLGFDARYLDRIPFVDRPGMEIADQARFHPRKYLAALVKRVDGDGSHVFEHTSADEITESDEKDQPHAPREKADQRAKPGTFAVKARDKTIRCSYIVIATHNPIVGAAGLIGASLFQTKLALYTSYVVGGRVPSGTVPDALFWDTAEPYRYLRIEPHRGFDYIIFGGEDHKTGQEQDTRACYAHLESALADLVPGVEVTHRWSGQVIETPDGLPYIGETAERQFVATGFAGNGMTFGTLGAMMACDAVLGRGNPWRDLFDVGRVKIRGGAWDYLKENVDYPYYLIRDRFAGAEGKSLRALRRGQGKILDLDGTRVAAYRAADGAVSLRSPICTHLGCVVGWNDAERTWDCPCHGSRFAPDGKVISGPAESPLDEIPKPSRSR